MRIAGSARSSESASPLGGRTDLSRFPWPFAGDAYRYSANVEPAPALRRTAAGSWGERIVDVDVHYRDELAQRAETLHHDPSRSTELPHMRAASWEVLDFLLGELVDGDHESMSLTRDGSTRHWRNERLGLTRHYVHGDDGTVPEGPLAFAASQVQEDIVLLDQREGTLFADAGVVTFASNWSLAFDTGMSFLDIHGPVPRDYADGAIVRAEAFLLRLQPGQAYRRQNWTSTVGRRLDTSIETYDRWGADRGALDGEMIGRQLSLRVEVQHLIRLPETNAVVFLIRTYLAGLDEIATVPGWADQLAAVLTDLPAEMADYKGFGRVRTDVIRWLVANRPAARIGD